MKNDLFVLKLAYGVVFGAIALYAAFLGHRARRIGQELRLLRGKGEG